MGEGTGRSTPATRLSGPEDGTTPAAAQPRRRRAAPASRARQALVPAAHGSQARLPLPSLCDPGPTPPK